MKHALLLLVLFPITAFAQQPPMPAPAPRPVAAPAPIAAAAPMPAPEPDPIARNLIPPELVMAHAQEIDLSEAQSSSIKSEIRKTQSRFLDLQWDLQEETGRMTQLLQQSPIDEAKVLERADKIMSLEREIKRAQLTLLVRLKNLLTPAQIAKLTALRR